MTIGVVLGAIWGFSKKVDMVMMNVYNILANIPYILFISVMVMLFTPSFWTMVLALTITGWLGIAYFIRTQVIIIRDREYNLASKCLGTSTFKIAMKNILPFMTSVIVTLLAAIGAIKYIQRIFTTRIVAAIVILISFTMAKPIVGLIFIIVNSLRSCNIARRNHARSFLCTYVLIILFVGITFLILYFTGVFQMMLDFIDKMVKIK
jgi:hypothetical protein